MSKPRRRTREDVLETRVKRAMEAIDEAGEAESDQVEYLGRIRDEVNIRLEGAIMDAADEPTDGSPP